MKNTIIVVLILIFASSCTSSRHVSSDNGNNEKYIKTVRGGVEYREYIDSFFVVDVMPEFPGGEANLVKFIKENLKYPKSATKDNTEGKVIITFVITETGEVKYPNVFESVRKDLDKAAIKMIRKMPKWKPGEKDGHPIKVAFKLPIVFKL